ncbi:SIR2-domain-containing protein [Rhizophagus clarus]|uniref:SIR2-domain-containing protein n=1 Tax=Rhizophagus clarus TaxID=94130 RepID=A0A8H3LNV5_9GLOM|nr:SIR2-domain-containing protein [Rhizophagus clarus]
MLTRRREENPAEVTSLSSPKRIRVGDSDHDSQYPTCFSTLSSSHTYTIPTITPVETINFSNQEDLTTSSGHSANHNHYVATDETIRPCQTSTRTVQFSLEASNQNLATQEYAIIETLNSIISQPEAVEIIEDSKGGPYVKPADILDEDVAGKHRIYVEKEDDDDDDDEDWNEGDHVNDSSDETSSIDDIIDQMNHENGDEDEALLINKEDLNIPPLDDEEVEYYKQEAREKGTQNFIQEYFFEKGISLQKLFFAFDYKLPGKINFSDVQLIQVLSKVVQKFLRQRKKLPNVNALEDVIELLRVSKNIMVLTGAGVSVSCGIPDFRSENGIYSRLSEFDLDDPQDMFDINYFRDCPEVFYSFAKEIYPSNFTPSPSHYFVKLLEEKGKLLRNYTQNIDTLEQVAGIENVLQCHGSFATASCIVCGYKVDGNEIKDDILNQRVSYCPKCTTDDDDIGESASIMKPDIVFFGEKLPPEFDRSFPRDREKVDLLIVMGSSLKVAPVSEIMGQIPHRVPQIVINRTPIKHMQFDVQLLGDCDIIIPELCRMLGWELVHEKLPGGSSSCKKSEPYRFLDPHVYLFEGAVVKQGDLSGLGVRTTSIENLSIQENNKMHDRSF